MEKRYQVFVSSTYTDLIDERKEVTQAILKCDCFPAGMELFPASNKQQWSIIKRVIDDSDFYVLIIAGRYGTLGIDDENKKVGFTEMEFNYALSQNKPIIVLLHKNPDSLPADKVERSKNKIERLRKFREKAQTGRLVAFWENKDQLHSAVLSSLHKVLSDTPQAIGWIRADSVVHESNQIHSETDLSAIFSEFKAIIKYDNKIDFLNSLSFEIKKELFNNTEFVMYFMEQIAKPENTYVCEYFEFVPYSWNLNSRAIKIISGNPLKNLFDEQHKKSVTEKDNNIIISMINMLSKLQVSSLDYAKIIYDYLKSPETDAKIRKACSNYFSDYRFYYDGIDKIEFTSYLMKEYKNNNRVLSKEEIIQLIVSTIEDEKDFSLIYSIFMDSNIELQKTIVDKMFVYCDAGKYFFDPQIQRKFFEICDIVYSWHDDTSAKFLLYCLFTRTYDIFTVDELFEKLNDFNDDEFFIFMSQLSFGEFGCEEETYELNETEKERVRNIIIERNHPRGNKLLEFF